MEYIYQLIDYVKQWFNSHNYEATFYQLLCEGKYDDALRLAQRYSKLDKDFVYKLKWCKSGVTVQSINLVLKFISDKLWAIEESVRVVPISYEACRALLEFGLSEANLRLMYQLAVDSEDAKNNVSDILPDDMSDTQIEGLIDFENLNEQQKTLCKLRQELLRYEHSLLAYENILGDHNSIRQHFDHVVYKEFREKCPLEACIGFARDGDAHAVKIMLNFFTDDLRLHLLPILSNFPETLSPKEYVDLLPRVKTDQKRCHVEYGAQQAVNTNETKTDFSSDWSGQIDSKTIDLVSLSDLKRQYETKFYSENEQVKKYNKFIEPRDLSCWFKERAMEMESRTLLLSNSIQLLHLGQEFNIENLQQTHDDLDEFARIIYDNCTDDNIYLSYNEFNQMDIIDRLLLMTENSPKNCKGKFRFYVIPYIHRREQELGFEGKTQLLRDYFRKLAHQRENICKLIYSDLLDKIECDTFVSEWTQGLDDVIDSIGEEIKTIERERQVKQLSTVAGQTMALGDLNACYQACQLIMRKSYSECWAHCSQLGMFSQFNNYEAKYELLGFALAHCDDPTGKVSAKILAHLIELRKRDEKLQLAYIKQNL